MNRVFIIILVITTFWSLGSAQNGDNPFEVVAPAKKTQIQVEKPSTSEVQSNNPFEVVAPSENRVFSEKSENKNSSSEITNNPFDITDQSTPVAADEKTEEIQQVSRVTGEYDLEAYKRFKFLLLIFSLVALTVVFTFFKSYFQRTIQAFTNENIMSQIARDRATVSGVPYQVLFFFSIFLLGVLLFLYLRSVKGPLPSSNLLALLYCVGGVGIVLLGKLFLLSLIKWVFPVKKTVNSYQFTILIFTTVLGLVSLPFSIWVSFGPENSISAALIIFLVMLVLIYAFRSVRALFLGSKIVSGNILHFLLYLCTVEIAPLLIGVKWLELF